MASRTGRTVRAAARVGAAAMGTLALGVAGAFAYFTATGLASGAAAVGSSAHWQITGVDGSGAPSSTDRMQPGGPPTDFSYRITNAGGGHQALQNAAVTLATATDASGNIVVMDSATGQAVPGCLADWFHVGTPTFTAALPTDLGGDGYVIGTSPVAMADVSAAQDACAGANLRLTVTAG